MEKINILLRQILFLILTFLSIVSYSQIYFNPDNYNLGSVMGNDNLTCGYTVISNSSSPITCTVHIDEVLADINWITSVYPEFFSFNSEGEAAFVEITGKITTSFPTGINTFKISYYDFDSPHSLLGTFDISFDFGGYIGVEDEVEISFGDYSFSEGDFIGYVGAFIDRYPFDDEIDEWNLKMELFTDEEEYTYVDITNTTGTWNFFAPEIPENMTFHRNDQGQILGVITMSGHDTDGYTHLATEYFGINKEPDDPILYIQPNDDIVDVHISNSGGIINYLHYDVNSGDPYSGTGLSQGNSPINMGDNENITIDGFQNCSKYFFAVKSNNQLGTSDYSNEKSIRIFSSENALPIQYHLSNCTIDNKREFEGNHYFNGDLIIETGATLLVVDGIMYFEEDSKIIIEPGGQLILNGATCTAPCGQTWQGIEVWGNSEDHQFEYTGHPLGQGKLVMKDAYIENAMIAVSTWKSGSYNKTGGIVLAKNSYFINNLISVEMLPYQNYHPFSLKPMDYVSYFTNCEFIVDDNYVMSSNFDSHITLADVNGIRITGCKFSNDISTAINTGNGINALNAGFRITSYCNSNMLPCPSGSLIPTTFSNFNTGIVALNSGSPNTIYANGAEFSNNSTGIQLNSVHNATLIFNTFEMGMDPSCTSSDGIGIDLVNCNGYAVEENTFQPVGAAVDEAIGVKVRNGDVAAITYNEIYRNTYNGVYIGSKAEESNFDVVNKRGLSFLCGINTSNDFDHYITGQGIQIYQGILGVEDAGNNFSHNSNNPYSDYNNQAIWPIIYLYNSDEPLYRSPTVTTQYESNTNLCLPHYGGGNNSQTIGMGLSQAQSQYFKEIFYTNKTNLDGTRALYNSLIDGGDTPGTIIEVENAWSNEMWETRAVLLALSPHLSRKVLVETADRTDLFPDAVIFEILSANPDAMKDITLLEYLETKTNPLPQYMIEILRSSIGTITYKTILEYQLVDYGGKMEASAYVILRNILNDSILQSDSLKIWLANFSSLVTDYQLIDVYLQERDTNAALALLAVLPNAYGFENTDVEYGRYVTVKELQIKLLSEGRNIFMLTTAEKNILEDIVVKSDHTAGMQARNILQFVYGTDYNYCSNMPDPITHKSGSNSINNLMVNMLEIESFPNPAKDWTTFSYKIPETENSASIEICDVTGKLIQIINLNTNEGQVVWDTRDTQPGIYLFTLKASGTQKTGKIVVAK